MKTFIKPLILISTFAFIACEDVIDVDVSESAPRLVIEASLDWEKGSPGNRQSIKLSTTTPYFDSTRESPVTGASVSVFNAGTEEEFVFTDQGDGTYTTDAFVPVLNNTYRLEIVRENETYTAEETLMPVVDIDVLTQSVEGGFDKDFPELNIYFSDPADETNFYLIWCQANTDFYPYLFDIDDEFVNGNQVHHTYEKDDDEDNGERPFEPGDTVLVKLFGISESYSNYIDLLISQSDTGGNPFGSIPATLRGNVVNQTNHENYALGYFRVAEVAVEEFVFE